MFRWKHVLGNSYPHALNNLPVFYAHKQHACLWWAHSKTSCKDNDWMETPKYPNEIPTQLGCDILPNLSHCEATFVIFSIEPLWGSLNSNYVN